MRALRDIEINWLLRPFRRLRIVPSVTRLWSIFLTVVIVLVLTGVLGVMVIVKITSLIHVFGVMNENAHNESVAERRVVVFLGMGLLAAMSLAAAFLERDRTRFYARAAGMTSSPPMKRFWLLVLSAMLPVLFALAYYLYGPQYIHP